MTICPTELIHIMQFADSVLPVGAFSFSNGIESAIQKGIVKDADSLKGFVRTALKQAASCDGIAVVAAHRAVLAEDRQALVAADRAVYNRKINEENQLMTTRMGKKLAELSLNVLKNPLIDWWLKQIACGDAVGTYPVTQAIIMAIQGIDEQQVVVMHQYGVAMTMLSAALRLMKITHFATQDILYSLSQDIVDLCAISTCGDISLMSSYVPIIDILASNHIDAHVRLFMN
ncbi:urease accessory protein UreF [Edwardsiella ictaluri]|uniref:Urease accessory protein UreF n=2 Tax=Edwardsiella ictaluri TaxID=67780 RepID=C5BBR4_EDWI9|nr:urease accessory protein F, putative [Edwardsiella ictaluri 93-146]ARD38491.1 urease accessory protein UreF [Edwardsiella ictaluri]KOO54181.1 urease accessory protein UreF [Edwardsiella ictaluri]STP80958.1 Urease accessory protein UreF [Edwardsiella ictaluri]BEH99111.1 urease accessory protein UreF [Edwardsiella ictaluri]